MGEEEPKGYGMWSATARKNVMCPKNVLEEKGHEAMWKGQRTGIKDIVLVPGNGQWSCFI